MKKIFLTLLTGFLVSSLFGQQIPLDQKHLTPNLVSSSFQKLQGKNVARVIKGSTVKGADQPTFLRVNDLVFKDGVIEVEVLSRLLPTASPTDRGFIGV